MPDEHPDEQPDEKPPAPHAGGPPTADLPPREPPVDPAPRPLPERIGLCQIRRVIASGGMGTVYEALQVKPRRTVAVKVMKHGATSRSALRRFEYESQILARLRHPGIAQVYEAGTYDDGSGGVPYFVMEYIPNGRPLGRFAEERHLGSRERAALFAKVCDAVHHGHQRGIIHRDLKPDNILVDSGGEPKIIDFGVARATDSDMAVTTLQTDVGQLVGTVQYMSPEQVEADPHDLDTRSDVYALGVVLYELLTGALPYDLENRSVYEAVRLVKEQVPSRPSTLDRSLRGDLETIVLKALEKDRSRRYQSADELRQELERYLDGAPITARPPSISYQLRVFARKHRAVVATAALVVLALVVGSIGTTAGMLRAQRGMERAKQAEADAERERARAEAVSDFLTKTLASANPFLPSRTSRTAVRGEVSATYAGEAGREIAAVDLLVRAAETLDEAFAEAPETRADLHHTLGETLLGLGQFAEARTQLERAVELQVRRLGADHVDTARTRLLLADALLAEGRGDRADRIYADAHAVFVRRLGEADVETLGAVSRQADALLHRGRLDEALDLQREALATAERRLGPDNLVTLDQMVRTCRMLWVATEIEASIDVGHRAVTGFRQIVGREAQATAEAMYELSGPLRSAGRTEEAYEMAAAALRLTRRNLGSEHPRALECMHVLASIELERGRFEACNALFEEALTTGRRLLAPTDLELLLTLNDYAAVLTLQGIELDEAEAHAREAWNGFKLVLGPDTQYALNAADTLAMVLRARGRPDEAIVLHEMIVTTAERERLQPSVLIYAHVGLGRCMTDLARYAEAQSHLRTALELAGSDSAPETLRAWQITPAFIALYEASGRPDDAARWRARE